MGEGGEADKCELVVLPLDGEGGPRRSRGSEGVKRDAFPVSGGHPLHRCFAAVLRPVEQSPGLFLGASAPIKGEDQRTSTVRKTYRPAYSVISDWKSSIGGKAG